MSDWSVQRARELYNIRYWGGGYFDIDGGGHLLVRPVGRQRAVEIDLHALVAELGQRGVSLPVLLRFEDILRDRVERLRRAFAIAMEHEGFKGGFTAVYPIKVNQQRAVVEAILAAGDDGVGLEAGSKAELMAILAVSRSGGTVICNGYKDREYLRLALIGRRMGQQVYIVIEKPSELALVLEEAKRLEVEPLLGVRVRLASIGSGKWQNTGGEKSKFGLSAAQLLQAVEQLRGAGMLGTLRLMHFHLGSQIPNIRDIQRGIDEGARYYAELHRLGVPIGIVDVGGGLGVDYEGSRTRSFCSMNYTIQEYANNIVQALARICTEQRLPHPHLITESGRALTAHHAVLITDVVAVERIPDGPEAPMYGEGEPAILEALAQNLALLRGNKEGERSLLESYHDAQHSLSEAKSMYTHGLLTLEQWARAEQLYFAICRHVHARLDSGSRAHRDVLDELNEKLADKYFCNLSLFQSLPDVWAIDQVFPVVPLQRLDEMPCRRAVLRDITCDSDGRIDHYVERNGLESTLPLHPLRSGECYLLGFFLVGAYQETLGDMHNLFGTINTVSVALSKDGGYRLMDTEKGDDVSSVLGQVGFDIGRLMASYRSKLATADMEERVRRQYLDELEKGLSSYTYLEQGRLSGPKAKNQRKR